MTEPVQPTPKPRKRPKDFPLIAASNAGILVALILLLSGIFADSGAVIVAGLVVAAVAIVLYALHASRRRRRMKT